MRHPSLTEILVLALLACLDAGKPITDVQKLERQDMLDMVGAPLTAARVKCAMLGLKVLKTGLYQYLVDHHHE